ncbi:hypothetical protein [Streptomyces beigongshangae]|uniref:hypothetical protein n=1 Tax=Streptomyces beigongshangae TaxID=2841597 RepID=UPI001C843CD2|nr:hypothetical protein [Streptomyces sp. REN17]
MHTLHEAVTRCRTLVVEGPDGICRDPVLAELARGGFLVRRFRGQLHHLDPTRPYREILAAPGLLAVDGGVVHELVYGPLRRGQSRVTWIQALDFAEAVAERDGALLHLTDSGPDSGRVADPEGAEAADAYARAFRTLGQHVPVVPVDIGRPTPAVRATDLPPLQLARRKRKLTVGW